ncbi:hypothetical protein SDC9_63084 [bioreactor metagenome]|uniref:Uncharacterized protein n=1 Tax=bioreactor metagenome TaxID=1076179 RepID=A0A644XR32_9ZZZZ
MILITAIGIESSYEACAAAAPSISTQIGAIAERIASFFAESLMNSSPDAIIPLNTLGATILNLCKIFSGMSDLYPEVKYFSAARKEASDSLSSHSKYAFPR